MIPISRAASRTLAARKPEWLESLPSRVRAWADRGVFFGGSSWKYQGGLGQIYRPDRYMTRGKFSKALFEKTCIKEYAEWFSFVGGDFSFYDFYGKKFWSNLFAQVPQKFLFALLNLMTQSKTRSPKATEMPQNLFGRHRGRNSEDFSYRPTTDSLAILRRRSLRY